MFPALNLLTPSICTACGIARNLGISRIILYRHSSILSAFGLALADVVHEVQEPSAENLNAESIPRLKERVQALINSCKEELVNKQGFQPSDVGTEVYLNLRYEGTDCALMTLQSAPDVWDFEESFVKLYKQEFGFTLADRAIVVDDIRVRGIGRTMGGDKRLTPDEELKTLDIKVVDPSKLKDSTASVYFESGRDNNVPVYLLSNLTPGSKVEGPAIIIDATATIVVEPLCSAIVTSQHITITVGKGEKKKVTTELEPIQLSIFSHRFMSIAEQMGRSLQKTAISTNIKERLDFSCALFGADGGLVANAPHIPVHLGALSHAVIYQMNYYKDDLHEGDVIMTNHPAAGGSHLPGALYSNWKRKENILTRDIKISRSSRLCSTMVRLYSSWLPARIMPILEDCLLALCRHSPRNCTRKVQPSSHSRSCRMV